MTKDQKPFILSPEWIVTVDSTNRVLTGHSLVVQGDLIVDICPNDQLQAYDGCEQTLLPDQVLMPGLVNAHCHGAMSLFRGMADDLQLDEWLNEHIWPAEGKWVSEQFIHDGTRLAVAEMLLTGTTCFNDMYFYPHTIAETVADMHMRACISFPILDFPTAMAQNADEYIHKGLAVHDDFKNHPLVTTAFGPHAPYTVSDAPLRQVRVLSDELQIPVHMHVHETAAEVSAAVQETGKRPLQRLDELGLLGPQFIAVHMTEASEEDIELVAASKAHVVHCPVSNMKLASGSCHAASLVDAGINVALGTDSATSNNTLDMFEEIKVAALLAKNLSGDASTLPAATVLRMATINGAMSIGLGDMIGSLEKGKQADIISVDFSSPLNQPVHSPVSQLVYGSNGSMVSNVWVAGRQLVNNRQLSDIHAGTIVDSAKHWLLKMQDSDD